MVPGEHGGDSQQPQQELRQRRKGSDHLAGMGGGEEADAGEPPPQTEAEIELEHQLQLQQEFKKKKHKVVGCVFGGPITLVVLGIFTGVVTVSERKAEVACADISDRDLCKASKADCCYDTITRNCTELDLCTSACAPGYESFRNLGVEPCISCEPGWADTDEDPTTPCVVCSVGTFAGYESIACSLCDGGTADLDNDPMTVCDACSSGKEASRGPSARQEEGATLCDACAQGMYDDDSDGGAIDALSAETPCIDCEAGRIASTAGQYGACQECGTGMYAAGGGSSCGPCPAGKQDDDSNAATECVDCSAGKFQPSAGAIACDDCDSGKVSSATLAGCDLCAAGKYANLSLGRRGQCEYCVEGQADSDSDPGSECVECVAAAYTYTSISGRIGACLNCSTGSYFVSTNECTPCPAGRLSASPDTPCADCASGKIAATASSISCVDCDPGKAPNMDSTACVDCAAGRYADPSQFECIDCAAGQADIDGDPSTPCEICAPGKWSAALDRCDTCSAGSYTPGDACTLCAVGEIDDDADSSTLCQPCPGGKKAHPDNLNCQTCGPGKYSLGQQDLCIGCTAGQFRPSASQECAICPIGQNSVAQSNGCGCSPGSEGTGLGIGCPQAVNGIPAGAIVCHCSLTLQSDTCAAALIPGFQGTTAAGASVLATSLDCGGCGSCTTMCAGFDPNSKACTICPAGKMDADENPTTPCADCANGQYSPQSSTGTGGCTDCAPGQADTDNDPSTPCVQCSPDHEAIAANGETRRTLCAACIDPQFDHDSDASTPCVCPAGMRGENVVNGNPGSCVDCSTENKYGVGVTNVVALGGEHTCTDCPAGSVATNSAGGLTRPTSCVVCPVGKHDDDSLSSTDCLMCRAGQYAAGGAVSCTSCAPDFYDHDADPTLTIMKTSIPPQSPSAATPCEACECVTQPGGGACLQSYAAPITSIVDGQTYGQVECTLSCASGTFGIPGGVCHNCNEGQSTDVTVTGAADSDSSDCLVCGAGKYNAAGLPCTDCAVGRYDDDSSSYTPCSACIAGQYSTLDIQESTGALGHQVAPTPVLSCIQCPADSYDDDDNATTPCIACPAGKSSSAGASSTGCSECAAGRGSWPALGGQYHVHPHGCFSGTMESSMYSYHLGSMTDVSAHTCAVACGSDASTTTDPWIRANNQIAIKGSACYCLSLMGLASLQSAADGECSVCHDDLGSLCGSSADPIRYSVYEYIDKTQGCTDCQAGQSSTSATPCSNCAAGFYSDQALATTCLACNAGSWSNQSTPSTFCADCVPGKSDSDSDPSTECVECSAGQFIATPGEVGCSDCPAGQGSNTTNSTDWASCSSTTCLLRIACLPCDAGSFAGGGQECTDCSKGQNDHDSDTTTSCQSCSVGEYSDDAAVTCAPCAAGRSDADVDPSTQCTLCVNGQHAPVTSSTACVTCAAGKQSSTTLGAATCTDCVAGRYTTDANLASGMSCQACAGGQVQPAPGSTSCIDCVPGQYSAGGGGGDAACGVCLAGEYQDISGALSCNDCTLGTNSSLTGADGCADCDAGRFTPSVKSVECTQCSNGRITASAGFPGTVCTACADGKIQDGSDFTRCVDCPSGHKSDPPGASGTVCIPCAAGKFLQGLVCQACAGGQVQPAPGSTSCIDCVPGKSSREVTLRSSCDQCTAGKTAPDAGSSSCVMCPTGRIQDGSNHIACFPCAAGFQSNEQVELMPVRTACESCAAGRNASYDTQCVDCLAGRYQASTAASTCGSCDPGRHSSSAAALCQDCPTGTFQRLSNSVTISRTSPQTGLPQGCPSCGPGSYQGSTGQTQCTACVAGTAHKDEGQTTNVSCIACVPGQYQDVERSQSCLPCVRGRASYSVGRDTECDLCEQGRYNDRDGGRDCKDCKRGTDVAERGVQKPGSCLPCNPEEACEGGGTCALGYTSGIEDDAAFCSFCTRGFFKLKDNCHKCPDGGMWISILAGMIFIGFAFMMLGLAGGSGTSSLKERASMSSMKIRLVVPFSIALTRFQLNLEFFNIDIQWPPNLLDWLKWFDFALNLDFGVVVSPECVADFEDPASAFIMRHVAMAAVFPCMCLAICVVFMLISLCRGKGGGNVINPMVATWQITFINSAKLVFRSFDCTQTETGYKLDAAPSIVCNPWTDDRYRPIFLTGVWVGLVYCLLIPIGLFGFLARTDKSDIERVQSHFGWVFLRYHPGRWYYETVLLAQKAIAGAITVFLASKAMLLNSLLANLFVTLVSLGMHQHFKPFPAFHDDPTILGLKVSDNLLEVFGLVLQMITLVGGLIFYYRNENDCNLDGTCDNICRYCFLGETGGEEPRMRGQSGAGFLRTTVMLPGADKEGNFWKLSKEPFSDPAYQALVKGVAWDQCEEPLERVDNRYNCEVWCDDEDPDAGRWPFQAGIERITWGGVCYYSGFRDADETKTDADNAQYVESNVETAVTCVILGVYALFIYLFVSKSIKTWRSQLAKRLGIGLTVQNDDDDTTSYLSLEDAATKRRERAALVTIFERLDADDSHTLSIDELTKAMDHISKFTYAPILSAEVTAALVALDEDKSGEIDMGEFITWITNPDDELAQQTAHILADVASANVALSSSEVGESTDYSLTDSLRLQFIQEILDAKVLIAQEQQTRTPSTADDTAEDGEKPADDGTGGTDEANGADANSVPETEDRNTRERRLAYVQHRLHADADAKEADLLYNMAGVLEDDKLEDGPQFGLQATHKFAHFYSRAANLHQKSCKEGSNLIVIPFGVRGGEEMYVDEQGTPVPVTQVYEITEAMPMAREIDPKSSRIGMLAVDTLIEVLEEKSFTVNSTDADDDALDHHQTIKRMRVVCKHGKHGVVRMHGVETGWITHTETLVQTDKPPLLSRIYTVPLIMTPGQCIETEVETEPGWYRAVRRTPRAADVDGLQSSSGKSYLFPGEVVRITDTEVVKEADDTMAQIALKFDWRMRHSTGATVGDWEGLFNAYSHAAFGGIVALVGLIATIVLLSEEQTCSGGASVRASDFCLSSRFFDSNDMAQCLAHSECCEWNPGAQVCESNRGDSGCVITGGSSGVCQHIEELILAAVITLAVGVSLVANVHRLHTHDLLVLLNTPWSIRLPMAVMQLAAMLVAAACSTVAYFAKDVSLIATSIALGVVALYSEVKSKHTRSLTRAAHLLVVVGGIQAVLLGMYTSKVSTWDHEGCVNSSGLAHLPEPAGISSPSSCARRCFEKATQTLGHHFKTADEGFTTNAMDAVDETRRRYKGSNSQACAGLSCGSCTGDCGWCTDTHMCSASCVTAPGACEDEDRCAGLPCTQCFGDCGWCATGDSCSLQCNTSPGECGAGTDAVQGRDQPGCVWTDSAMVERSPCTDYWAVDAGSYAACEALCIAEPTCSFIQSDVGFDTRCELVRGCDPSTVPAAGGEWLLRSRECLVQGSCSDPMALTFNPEASTNQGGCAYDCVTMHVAFRTGTSDGACEILHEDVHCTGPTCVKFVADYASLIIQGIPPVGFVVGSAPTTTMRDDYIHYSVALAASQGASLAIRHIVYSPEAEQQSSRLRCTHCTLVYVEYCAFVNHLNGAVELTGPMEPSSDSMLTGLIMKHVLVENNPPSGELAVITVRSASATFLGCYFNVDQNILADGEGATVLAAAPSLKIIGTEFAGTSGSHLPTVTMRNWQYDWSVVGVEPNGTTFFDQQGTTAELGRPTTCASPSACAGSQCDDVNLPGVPASGGGEVLAGITCSSCPPGQSGADCTCANDAKVVGSHCATTAPVVAALRGAGLVLWNDAESELTTRFAIGSVLGQQRCWCGVDEPLQTVDEQLCADERITSGPRTVRLMQKVFGNRTGGNSYYVSDRGLVLRVIDLAGTYTAQGTLNGRLRYVQTSDVSGSASYPEDCFPTLGGYLDPQCRFTLSWNGAVWVVFDTQASVYNYRDYAQRGDAASRGLSYIVASTNGAEIHNSRWADFSVQIVADGNSASTVQEVYRLRGSAIVGDIGNQCFAYSTTCGISVAVGIFCALLGLAGFVGSFVASGSGKRPAVRNSTGWVEAWAKNGPRHGLMLLERIVDLAVVKQLDAAARMRATTVVTLGLPDQLTMLHATTGFIASQPLLWLKSKRQGKKKHHDKKKKKGTQAARGEVFNAHLVRDSAVFGAIGALVGAMFDDDGYAALGTSAGVAFACVESAWRSPMRRSSKISWMLGTAALAGALAARSVFTASPVCSQHSDCEQFDDDPAFCHNDGICRSCAPKCECVDLDGVLEIPNPSVCSQIDLQRHHDGHQQCEANRLCNVDYSDNSCREVSADGARTELCTQAGLSPSCTCGDILNIPNIECDMATRYMSASMGTAPALVTSGSPYLQIEHSFGVSFRQSTLQEGLECYGASCTLSLGSIHDSAGSFAGLAPGQLRADLLGSVTWIPDTEIPQQSSITLTSGDARPISVYVFHETAVAQETDRSGGWVAGQAAPCSNDLDWVETYNELGYGCDGITANGHEQFCNLLANAAGVSGMDACPVTCGGDCGNGSAVQTESFEDAAWSTAAPVVSLNTSSYPWSRHSGNTPSSNTGPSSAYDGSYYLFTEASNNYNQVFILDVTQPLAAGSSSVLTFRYHMYGFGMGTLFVETVDAAGTSTVVWTRSGEQTSAEMASRQPGSAAWLQATVVISPNVASFVVIKGLTGASFGSDMAIDAVSITGPPPPPSSPSALQGWTPVGLGPAMSEWRYHPIPGPTRTTTMYRASLMPGESVALPPTTTAQTRMGITVALDSVLVPTMTIQHASYGSNCPGIEFELYDRHIDMELEVVKISQACSGRSSCSYAVDPTSFSEAHDGPVEEWWNAARGKCVKAYVVFYVSPTCAGQPPPHCCPTNTRAFDATCQDCGCGVVQMASVPGAGLIHLDCAKCGFPDNPWELGTSETTLGDVCPQTCHTGKSCFNEELLLSGSGADSSPIGGDCGASSPCASGLFCNLDYNSTGHCQQCTMCSDCDCGLSGEAEDDCSASCDQADDRCGFDWNRGCQYCHDGIDGTCGMCAPGGRSEIDQTCEVSIYYSRSFGWTAYGQCIIRASAVPGSAALGLVFGALMIALVTDLGSVTATVTSEENKMHLGNASCAHSCAHCLHGTSEFAIKFFFSVTFTFMLCVVNLTTQMKGGLGAPIYDVAELERSLWNMGMDGPDAELLVPWAVMTGIVHLLLGALSHRTGLLADLGGADDSVAATSADSDDEDVAIAIIMTNKTVTAGNALILDGQARDSVEAVALAPTDMLQGRMLIPVIEYAVRAKTSVRAYPDASAPAVGSVGKRAILVALEERVDQSGHLWVQFRNSSITLDSNLGWVEVESSWDKSSQSDSLPAKLGLPHDLEDEAAPANGSTLGFTFTEAPQPVFILSRYDSAQNDNIHWRHAFAKAKINCGIVVCPTTFFAAVKVDGCLAEKSADGSWYFEVQVNFNGIAQIGWATEEFESASNRAPFVGNDSFSWSFDGHSWVIWHGGKETNVKPFEPTKFVRVVMPKKSKKKNGTKVTIVVFTKPGILSQHGKLELEAGYTFQVERQVHTREGDWVFVNCPSAWREGDTEAGGKHEGWLRLPNTSKVATKLVKKAFHGDGDGIDVKHWATDTTLERVSDADAASSGNVSLPRWKAGDVIGCKLHIDKLTATMTWDWNGRRLPEAVTTTLTPGQSLRPVMSCIGGPLGRPTATFAISPREMRYDVPQGYETLVCGVARSSHTKEVIVTDSKAAKGSLVTVQVPEGAKPGSQVEATLPSGHTALVFVPDKTKDDNTFEVNFPSAPSIEDGGVFAVTIEKDWLPGSTQTVQTQETRNEKVEVRVPADGKEGDKITGILPPNAKSVVTIRPRDEPILKLKAKDLKHPVGTKFHVLSEMATAEGDWLQIASETPAAEDASKKTIAGTAEDPESTGGTSTIEEGPPTLRGEVLGWVLIRCDKHEHEEAHLKRVVEPERELVVSELGCAGGTGKLCIRQASSTTAKVVRKVSAGAVVEMVDSVAHQEGAAVRGADDGVWLQVRSNEQIGWAQVMVAHPVQTAEPRSRHGFQKKEKDLDYDEELIGVHLWHCLPQSIDVIESLERTAPAQYIEVSVPSLGGTPVEPGALVEVPVPLTGHTMQTVVPAKALWREKKELGKSPSFSFVTRVVDAQRSAEQNQTSVSVADGVDEGTTANLLAPEELEKTLQVVDCKDACSITAADDGIGTKITAAGGPATVRGCARGGRGRWYFEVSVSSGEGYVGICSTQFQNRKKTRAPHHFERLKGATVLEGQQRQRRYDMVENKGNKGNATAKELKMKAKQLTSEAHDNANDETKQKWSAEEMAYVTPLHDAHSKKRSAKSEYDRAQMWQEGEMFRAIVDHQVYEVAIPPAYAGGVVGFEVRNCYTGLGEDPNSLNCGYNGHARPSHTAKGLSSGFSTRLPDIEWKETAKGKNAWNVKIVEGQRTPVALATSAGNAAKGMLFDLRGWKANDVIGVCVDTAELAVHYSLNGVPIGNVSYDGFDSYEAFYPAASIAGGDDMTFFFRECDTSHSPPLSACQYFKVGQEAIDEEADHESEPWEKCEVTLPEDAAGQDDSSWRVPVKTHDGRVIMTLVPEGSKPGATITVKVPAARLIGHYQVLIPAILRRGVSLTSPKVVGAADRLKLGSVISIFDIRAIKSTDASDGVTEIKRARTTAGWFNLTVDGQDSVVEAEEVADPSSSKGRSNLHDVERDHTEQQRQEAQSESKEKHLGKQGIARAEADDVSVAFTASAIEFHSNRRGDGDAQAAIDAVHSNAQISTTVNLADNQPAVTKRQPTTFHPDTGNTTVMNPMSQDAEQENETELAPGGEVVIFDNPTIGLDGDDPVAEIEHELEPEPAASPDQLPAAAANITPADQANAMLHLDSSHHHAEFDDFMRMQTESTVVDNV